MVHVKPGQRLDPLLHYAGRANVVRPRDLSRLNAAFFTANGVLSVWLFAATAADLLLRRR